MKTKIPILIMLVLQLCFAFVFLVLAPELSGSIKVGLEHLQTAAPSESPTGARTSAGDWILKTSGDFFSAALQMYRSQTIATLIFILANIILLVWLLVVVCKVKNTSR